jgi:hypothetical protein
VGTYLPLEQAAGTSEEAWIHPFMSGEFTADELLARYLAEVYRLTGSYEEAARRMKVDRRTDQGLGGSLSETASLKRARHGQAEPCAPH